MLAYLPGINVVPDTIDLLAVSRRGHGHLVAWS
jgi:hypothetical protein